jgi:polyisoprenoid-binding protein YceI
MKRYIAILMCAGLMNISHAQTTWIIDNGNSNVNFAIQWQQNSFRTGTFKVFDGQIACEKEGTFEGAKVSFKLTTKSIDLIANNLTSMAQNEEYLNSMQFPEISFVSTSVKKSKKKMYEVSGMLTVKGVSRPAKFMMEDNGTVQYNNRTVGALKVTGQLNKSDFKIFGGADRLGETIKIEAYLETQKLSDMNISEW